MVTTPLFDLIYHHMTRRLTNDQFEVLFDILRDTVDALEGDLTSYYDKDGNEIDEKIEDYEAHKIYQQMIRLSGGF